MIPKYRPDIDGLRAVAVLSVVLYHVGSSLFSGGYVGVDVFFVISGYLITTIIVKEIASGSFSIARFYERRARRILPALTAMVAATLLVGNLLLADSGRVDLGRSAIATALFSSNILFFLQAGYFDGPAEMKPLLHTWSLAVEEQYYIFFPLLLILIARFSKRRYLAWLAGLGALSLLACIVVTRIDASAAFYLIPTRAWELFLGSILSLHVLPQATSRSVREGTSLLGAGLIAYAVFRFTPDTPFPGVAATLPTIGAGLVIYAGIGGGASIVSRILSLRPVVFIGLISYSLYLWHWPVIAYTKLYSITGPTMGQTAVMVAAIFALSILSWRYVELPFRKAGPPSRTPLVLRNSAGVLAAIACTGLLIAAKQGLPTSTVASSATASSADPEWERWGRCEKALDHVRNVADLCDIGASQGPVTFLLWGDSHARALASGVQRSAASHGMRGKITTRLACPPLASIERPSRTSCNDFNNEVLQMLARSPDIHTVILAARWALSTTGKQYKAEAGPPVRLVDLASPHPAGASNVALFDLGLTRTIDRLHRLGKQVVLVDPVPEVGYDVPSAFFAARLTGRDVNRIIAPTAAEYATRTRDVASIFSRELRSGAVEIVDPARYLCTRRTCLVVDADQPLYRDDDHLSTFGSRRVAPAFDSIFASAGGRQPAPAH